MGGGGCCGRDVGNGEGDRKKGPSCSLSPRLSLESYMDFCDDLHKRPDFIIPQLNHIIFMHGFIRMHGRHKAEIMRTLDAMELMQAARSTLEESISRRASLTLDEVRRDIQAIGWQGCLLGSVQSMEPPDGEDAGAITVVSPVSAITIASPMSAISAAAAAASRGERKKKKRKAAADTNMPMTSSSMKGKRKRSTPCKELYLLPAVGPADDTASR